MPQIILENNQLRVALNTKGAELTSIFHKEYQLEYIWGGNPAVWGKHSPVLFPIVGTLKNNRYIFEEKEYELPRHGFAREKEFSIAVQTGETVSFLLTSDETTLEAYPFAFQFYLHYRLHVNKVAVTYEVVNSGDASLYFSAGAHPAFAIPLVAHTAYEDYYLLFEKEEPLERWPITPNGLIDDATVPVVHDNKHLPLTKALFSKDALVFKNLQSTVISIRSAKTPHGLRCWFTGFPYMGIWAAKGADFVCIEPWCGIADSIHSRQQLTEKEGIIALAAQQRWKKEWGVELF
jgi:galactose mutarotase-like enzyme